MWPTQPGWAALPDRLFSHSLARWSRQLVLMGASAWALACGPLWAQVPSPAAPAPVVAPVVVPVNDTGPPLCDQLALAESQGQAPALATWQQALQGCQKNPGFLAALGQLLNRQGQYSEAAGHLERALLLAPARQDAQLAYALALAGTGDLLSAQAFLQDLLQDPQLPAPLRQQIAQQEQQLASLQQRQELLAQIGALANGWASRFTFTARYGQDSNLLGSPNLSSLNLTFGSQTLSLPLEEQYLAKSGNYLRADLQLELGRKLPNGSQLDLLASLRQRNSPAEPLGNNTQADVVLEQSKLTAGFYWNVTSSNLDALNGIRYQVNGLGAGFSAEKIGRCAARWGVEVQERSYLSAQVLSGSYTGLALGSLCNLGQQKQLLLSARSGLDRAKDPARPGADQRLSSLRALLFWPLQFWGADSLVLDLEQAIQQDQSGYSPLMLGGAARVMQRQAQRLEYQKQLGRRLQWLLGLERLMQSSNLELFQAENSGAYTSLRWVW